MSVSSYHVFLLLAALFMMRHLQVVGGQNMFELGKSVICETRPESKLYTAISLDMFSNSLHL